MRPDVDYVRPWAGRGRPLLELWGCLPDAGPPAPPASACSPDAVRDVRGLSWKDLGGHPAQPPTARFRPPDEMPPLPYERAGDVLQYPAPVLFLGARTGVHQAAIGCRYRCTFCRRLDSPQPRGLAVAVELEDNARELPRVLSLSGCASELQRSDRRAPGDLQIDGTWLVHEPGWPRAPVRTRSRSAAEVYDARGAVAQSQYHLLWPNLTININPGFPNLSLDVWMPDGPNATKGFSEQYFAPGVSEEFANDLIAFNNQVGAEDDMLTNAVQRGLLAGIPEQGRLLTGSEHLVVHFQKLVLLHASDRRPIRRSTRASYIRPDRFAHNPRRSPCRIACRGIRRPPARAGARPRRGRRRTDRAAIRRCARRAAAGG